MESPAKILDDPWNPQKYDCFSKERSLPFYDLMSLVSSKPDMRIIDLGCGTGKLTQILHTQLHASQTIGIDISENMLKESKHIHQAGLIFQRKDVKEFAVGLAEEKYDLIFSNACLHWLPNHEELFAQLSRHLNPQGQLAIQIPANFDYPTHTIAQEIATENPFRNLIKSRPCSILNLEQYAELFYRLRFKHQIVRMQVYGHVLDSTQSAIEWTQGTLLTYYRSHLPEPLYDQFFQIYQKRVLEYFGYRKPFFFPFKRLLLYATKTRVL